jgi:hypothetical protein
MEEPLSANVLGTLIPNKRKVESKTLKTIFFIEMPLLNKI